MFRLNSIFVIALTTILSCKIVQDNQGSAQTLSSYRITNSDVDGWSFQTGFEWVEFTKIDMYSLVDGAAEPFTKGGLIKGAAQRLSNQNGNAEFWIMDFGSAESASQMFQNYVALNFEVQKAISDDLPKSIALLDDAKWIDGSQAIVKFGQYLILSQFTKYGDATISISDAQLFNELFKQKNDATE